MYPEVYDRSTRSQVNASRSACTVSTPPATERFSGRPVQQASSDGEADALHFAPSTVDPPNSSDQTRLQVGGCAAGDDVVVGRGVGVGVNRMVVDVDVDGVALGVGVVIPTVRVPVGV
jgi:hypothetical protein